MTHDHKTDTENLVERLRDDPGLADCDEAADRIEALEAEKEAAVAAAYEDAARECERAAYSGDFYVDDQIELGCLRSRDCIRTRARADTDAQAALEKVKQESWRQGYKEGTGEISAAIEEAAAFKLMYSKSRNEALREAAELSYQISNSVPPAADHYYEARYCDGADMCEQAILALITDTDKGGE